MLKLATLIENPGEPGVESRYRDPVHLRELGYNAKIIYGTTALSGLESLEVIDDPELRRWTQQTADRLQQEARAAAAADLQVYLFYDVLVLPAALLARGRRGATCRRRDDVLCPGSPEAWELALRGCEAMLHRFPEASGIVLRFGDTDAPRLPHLVGNEIYTPHCPRCGELSYAARIVDAVSRFYDLVVERFDRRLIVRAWNLRPGGMHDKAELAAQVAAKLPGSPEDDRLMLSFKFTETDFWRYQRWNPASLACGGRPVLYELQCQREFEGKGGIPNWQPPLWRDGPPEIGGEGEPTGLAGASAHANVAGLWAWVRGGGWGGPFVRDETWIDANVWAVPRLADAPGADLRALAETWVRQELKLDEDAAVEAVCDVLMASAEVVRRAFYVEPFAQAKRDPWHPAADWLQDDVLDAHAAWRIVQRLSEPGMDRALSEKQLAAEEITRLRTRLQRLADDRGHRRLEPLVNSLAYAESLIETLRDLLAGLIAYRRHRRSPNPGTAEQARQALYEAQSHWSHHTQRLASRPGAASAFREEGLWDLSEQVFTDLARAGSVGGQDR